MNYCKNIKYSETKTEIFIRNIQNKFVSSQLQLAGLLPRQVSDKFMDRVFFYSESDDKWTILRQLSELKDESFLLYLLKRHTVDFLLYDELLLEDIQKYLVENLSNESKHNYVLDQVALTHKYLQRRETHESYHFLLRLIDPGDYLLWNKAKESYLQVMDEDIKYCVYNRFELFDQDRPRAIYFLEKIISIKYFPEIQREELYAKARALVSAIMNAAEFVDIFRMEPSRQYAIALMIQPNSTLMMQQFISVTWQNEFIKLSRQLLNNLKDAVFQVQVESGVGDLRRFLERK